MCTLHNRFEKFVAQYSKVKMERSMESDEELFSADDACPQDDVKQDEVKQDKVVSPSVSPSTV